MLKTKNQRYSQLDYIWVGPKKRSFEKLTKSKRLSKPKRRLGEKGGDSLTEGLLVQSILPHPETLPKTGSQSPEIKEPY